jgi:general secretion pathway protein L
MKTSPTDASAGAGTLLVFADAAGMPERWLALGDHVEEGDASAGVPKAGARTVLVVPGEQVTIHWLELAEGLTQPQAAAAARLMLADASAEPLGELHVAVGRSERGMTPVALASAARMAAWLAGPLDPDVVLPSPMLLPAPEEGFARRDRGEVSDYRGAASAFTLEPDLGEAVTAGAPVDQVDEARFRTQLPAIVADPPVNLRQGPFARRRQWQLSAARQRRVAVLVLALILLSLAVQVATILSYTFAADSIEAEAEALAARGSSAGGGDGPGFGAAAAPLFEAIRATPNVELARIDYRPDGSLTATVMMDGPATLTALQARLEAAGLRVEPGEQRTAGGRPIADLTVRPT